MKSDGFGTWLKLRKKLRQRQCDNIEVDKLPKTDICAIINAFGGLSSILHTFLKDDSKLSTKQLQTLLKICDTTFTKPNQPQTNETVITDVVLK